MHTDVLTKTRRKETMQSIKRQRDRMFQKSPSTLASRWAFVHLGSGNRGIASFLASCVVWLNWRNPPLQPQGNGNAMRLAARPAGSPGQRRIDHFPTKPSRSRPLGDGQASLLKPAACGLRRHALWEIRVVLHVE